MGVWNLFDNQWRRISYIFFFFCLLGSLTTAVSVNLLEQGFHATHFVWGRLKVSISRIPFIWVAFLYKLSVNDPPTRWQNNASKKRISWECSSFIVNWISVDTLFSTSSKDNCRSRLIMRKVSPTCLPQNYGWRSLNAILPRLGSSYSARMPEIGDSTIISSSSS